MSDTTITLRGRVGTELAAHTSVNGQMTTRFRLAVTNWFAAANGELVQGRTHWYSVRAWERLADNALHSIKKGEPVIVVGRPSAHTWIDKNGKVHAELVITAQSIGHDLAHGRSAYARAPKVEIPEVCQDTAITSSSAPLRTEEREENDLVEDDFTISFEEAERESEMGEEDIFEDEVNTAAGIDTEESLDSKACRDSKEESHSAENEGDCGIENPGVFGRYEM